MDVARTRSTRAWWRPVAVAGIAVGLIALVAAVTRPQAMVPSVEAGSLWRDTVRRGPLVRRVRGLGALVPEEVRWIAATSAGRVERILVRPGSAVSADTVILELSNPELEQQAEEARLRQAAAEASLSNLRMQLQGSVLQQRAAAAALEAELQKARMQADVNQALADRQLVSELVRRQSLLEAEQLVVRRRLVEEQVAVQQDAATAALAVQQALVDQARATATLKARQLSDLRVRAGIAGVLQTVTVDVGQQVAYGTSLARVADPSRLKAEVKVAETLATGVTVGQRASVDTRTGIVPGHVARIDPSVQGGTRTVDIVLDGPLPPGAVPDLSVDGTIELERLDQVLYMARPASGQPDSRTTLFRVEPDGAYARRVTVSLGRASTDAVEVRDGLAEGDIVILSDMAAWDGADRLRLK